MVNTGLSPALWAAQPTTSVKRTPPPQSDPALRAKVARSYGRLPLSFEPNHGQTDKQVKFLSRGRGYRVFLTPDETVLSLRKQSAVSSQQAAGGNSKIENRNSAPAPSTQNPAPDVLRMKLVGASQTAALEGAEKLPGISNYFIGRDPTKWHTNIPNYRRVAAKQVYPGIDLVYYGRARQLEYDFVIAPGADPRIIRFAVETGNWELEKRKAKNENRSLTPRPSPSGRGWPAGPGEGAPPLRIDSNGDLVVTLDGGEVRFHKPLVYQEQLAVGSQQSAGSSRQPSAVSHQLHPNPDRVLIEGRFVLLASAAGNHNSQITNHKSEVGFEVGPYDKSRPLVIDPVLSYSTYVGGSEIDIAKGVAVGSDGTVFITGETDSADFPTEHALQPRLASQLDFPDDLFVSKISRDGSTLIYSTFLGGEAREIAGGIAVDAFGAAYITGTTLSIDYPTTQNGFDPSCGLDGRCDETNNRFFTDAVVTKLNPAGSALAYSSFFTASLVTPSHEQGFAIAVDANGNANVTGSTTINDNAFIIAVDATGSALNYQVALGGSGNDQGFGIAAARDGTVSVTGFTNSADFPTTGNALQPVFGGVADGFLARITPAGAAPYVTYLGGSGADQGNGVALDTAGLAYVTGVTNSLAATFPFAIPGAPLQADCALNALLNCDGDAFVAKLDPTQAGVASLLYFTYLGGANAETGSGIAVDTLGSAYVTGFTNSPDFPVLGVPSQIQGSYGGGNTDAFVSKLDAAATALVYSTYLGGTNADEGKAIAVDANTNAYVAGQTCSTDFPLARPLQGTQAGNCDAFVAKVLVGADIDLSASSLDFGVQQVGNTSLAQKVTITSIGESNLNLGAVAITGDFTLQTDGCSGQSLAPNNFCEIDITFTPTALGPKTGTLTIPDNVAPGSHTVNLSGSGASVGVSLSPTELIFGDQGVNTSSTQQTVTMTNTGGDLTIFGIDASGNFSQNNTCGNLLLAGGSCQIMVTFTPTAIGIRTGAITITDSDPTSPQIVTLTGHGTAPLAAVTPTNLAFGNQGGTGAAQMVTLSNSGNAPLAITSIAVTGPFSETDTCGGTLVAGASCQISVNFNPVTPGVTTGQLTITTNAAGSPDVVTLSGTGVVPVVSLSPASLTFAEQPVNTTSDVQTVVLTNTGNATLNITSAVLTGVNSGDFGLTNNCPAAVLAGGNCTLTVTFSPTAAGTRLAAVMITDDAAESPQMVALTGVGVLAPWVTLAPASLSYADTQVGNTTAGQTVTVTNSGSAELLIISIATTGDFTKSDQCGASIAAGANCAISVTFTPTDVGNRYGTLTITDNATGSPHVLQLAGNGLPAPAVSLAPTSLTFAEQAVNTTSAAKSVVLTNTGTATLNIASVTTTGANAADFAPVSGCGATLAAGASCTINVTFTPTAAGTRVALLSIADNAANTPQTVSLSGVAVLAPSVSITPSSLTFADLPVGTTSPAQTVTLQNTGSAELLISSIATTGDFTKSDQCGAALAVGASCVISVTFKPTEVGNRYGTLTITDNAAGSPHSVLLAGNGLPVPTVSLFPATLTFGDQAVNTTSASQTVTLTNTGGAPLAITSVSISGANGGDFGILSTSCSGTYAPGAGCTISVVFTPSAAGARTASLDITDNAPTANSTQSVPLAGNGVLPAGIAFNPTSLTFPAASVGTPSAEQTITLTNTGGGTLNILGIVITGANASDFSLNHNCGATVAPTLSCTLRVIFTPSAAGSRQASITVTDNAAGSPHTVPLFGGGSTAAGDFILSVDPASATVFAGDTASYTLAVTPLNEFSAKVNLSCSATVSQGSCSVDPTSVTPAGTEPVTATVRVRTTARVMAPPAFGPKDLLPRSGIPWMPGLLALMLVTMIATARRKRTVLVLAALMTVLTLWSACGGGGTIAGVPRGTPVGNYTVTITATSGSTVKTTAVTVTVN